MYVRRDNPICHFAFYNQAGGNNPLANTRRTYVDPTVLRRRKNRNRVVVLAFFLLIGLVALIESPLTRIRSLTVTGNTSIPQAKILTAAKLHKGMNMWQVNAAAAQQRIKHQEPLVASVSVKTSLLHGTVALKVEEKHVVALYETHGTFYRVLEGGDVYGSVQSASGLPWPIVTSAQAAKVTQGQAVPVTGMVALSKQLAKSSPGFLTRVSEIELDQYGNATVYLDSGFAARCRANQFSARIATIEAAVSYFSSNGYQPGMIDVSSGPPYEYTPFQTKQGQAKSPKTGKQAKSTGSKTSG